MILLLFCVIALYLAVYLYIVSSYAGFKIHFSIYLLFYQIHTLDLLLHCVMVHVFTEQWLVIVESLVITIEYLVWYVNKKLNLRNSKDHIQLAIW